MITLIILASLTSFADVSIEKLGEWGTGIYNGITKDSNNNLYCITEVSGIDIFSITTPDNPIKIGNLPYNKVENIHFEGNTAYLSRGTEGITVVNIENLNSPQTIVDIAVEGYSYDCTTNGSTLFVASGSQGLTTFDITSITSPVLLNSFTEETDSEGNVDIIFSKTVKVFYENNTIYAADKNTGYAIIDVTDPSTPKLTISYKIYGGIEDFVIEDTRLYLQKNSGFRILNIEDINAISTVASFSSVKKINKMVKAGTTMLLADSELGLTVTDLETESSPTLVQHHFLGGIASGIVVVENHAYISDSYNGLVTVDISDLEAITNIANYNNNGYTRNLEVSGDNLYVSDLWNGTRVIDKTNLLSPQLLASIHKNNITNNITAGNANYIYTSDSSFGVSIIDITTPETPEVISTFQVDGLALSTKQKDNNLFVASEWNGVNIIDISDPVTPVLAGHYYSQGYIYNVDFYNDTLVTASGTAGIELIDITNPSSPSLISTLNTGGYVFDVTVKGDYAYLLDFFKGLVVVDISNTQFPVTVSTAEDLAYSSNLSVKDDYLYLSQGIDGFSIWNISNPSNPFNETTVDTNGNVEYIKVDGSNFYVADGNSGKIFVYSFTENPSSKLYIPHIALNGWTTLITFENSDSVNSNALCKAFNDNSLTFKNKVEVENENTYTISVNDGKWGFVETGDSVSGTIKYIQNSTGQSVSLPISKTLSNNLNIEIPSENNIWAGIAIYNENIGKSTITISLLDIKGNKISDSALEIEGRNNKVFLLSSLFENESIEQGASVHISGDGQYTGLMITGDEFGNLYGNVPMFK